jgi:hypothetical protein
MSAAVGDKGVAARVKTPILGRGMLSRTWMRWMYRCAIGSSIISAGKPAALLGFELPFELGESLAHGGLRYPDAPRRHPQAAGLSPRSGP